MAMSIRIGLKEIKRISFIILIILIVVGVYFLATLFVIPKYFPNLIKNDEKVVYDESKFPPIIKPEEAGLFPAMEEIVGEKDYLFNITSLGNPAYTFRYYYKKDWLFGFRDSQNLVFTQSDGYVDFNIKVFLATDTNYNLSCEEIVSELYPDDSVKIGNSKDVKIFDDTWNRVEYTGKKNGVDLVGISQCNKKSDTLFVQTLYSNKEYFEKNIPDILKVVDDIKINNQGVAW